MSVSELCLNRASVHMDILTHLVTDISWCLTNIVDHVWETRWRTTSLLTAIVTLIKALESLRDWVCLGKSYMHLHIDTILCAQQRGPKWLKMFPSWLVGSTYSVTSYSWELCRTTWSTRFYRDGFYGPFLSDPKR